MKSWILRISVIAATLALLAVGSWFIWYKFYSAEQFREAVAQGIAWGDFSRAERLLVCGAATERWRDEEAKGQFVKAVTLHRREEALGIARLLLLSGWGINHRFADGQTLLHATAVTLPGPDVDVTGYSKSRPTLDCYDDIARELLAYGADPNLRQNSGSAPLHLALLTGKKRMARVLISAGADVNTDKPNVWTALHIVAKQKDKAMCRDLLRAGADAGERNPLGQTAVDLWPELAEIVKELEALRLRSGQAEKAGKKQPAQPKVAIP